MTKAKRDRSVGNSMTKSRLSAQGIRHPVLKKGHTAEAAFRALMRACAGEIAHNWQVVLNTTDIEGPHQLRIGLRRLRSSLGAFQGVAGRKQLRRLEAEARQIATVVGELRDLDVLSSEIVAAAIDKSPDDGALVVLQQQLDIKRKTVRDEVEAALTNDRMVLFLLRLGQTIEASRRRAKPKRAALASGVASAALDKSWARVVRWGRNIDRLSIAERHKMRKALKTLRYQTEAFRGLYRGSKTKSFIKKIKDLQDVFGYLNDVAMAEKLSHMEFDDVPGEVDLNKAIGTVLKLHVTRSKKAWRRAQRAWDALDKSGPFWVE